MVDQLGDTRDAASQDVRRDVEIVDGYSTKQVARKNEQDADTVGKNRVRRTVE